MEEEDCESVISKSEFRNNIKIEIPNQVRDDSQEQTFIVMLNSFQHLTCVF